MTELEDRLRSLAPREPSADFYRRGVERMRAASTDTRHDVYRWRFAAMTLAGLLLISASLNLVLWNSGQMSADPAERTLPPRLAESPRGATDGLLGVETSSLVLSGDAYVGEAWYESFEADAE